MTALLRSKTVRDAGLQAGFTGGLFIMIVVFVLTAQTNLEAQGLTSGFGFLERATGWEINFSLIDYSTSSPYWRAILVGVLNSIFVGAIGLTVATVLGVTAGVMRTSGNGMAELLGTAFVEIFRNVPLLLQLFFWYALLIGLPKPKQAPFVWDSIALTGRGIFVPGLNVSGGSVFLAFLFLLAAFGLSLWLGAARRFSRMGKARKKTLHRSLWLGAIILGILSMWLGRLPDTPLVNMPYLKGLNYREGIRISPELLACIIAISIYGAAYIAEIIRAGFNAIPGGQSEAGHALGLSRWQIFSRIRLPLAIRVVLPTMINQYVWLFKATTIGIAIGFADFFMVVSTSINQSGQTLELIGILMGGYLLINYSMAWVLNRVNDAIKLKGTQLRI
ncbi:amino acid ABC transporter permease [Leisingera sp. ANG-DT]|uniref:amino acid ABC transporter permease n=1 Tax=Leisingera sp. ANG-DT TaxID=1577897 RepID=UPI00057FED20|nr:ABC transporter permease subunit [Leisingera sp. ANG-DT]KIC15834.1 ABC transporter permease [Leisingera sp. ANG-DT]